MGQIIRLTAFPADYPSAAAELDRAERVLLSGIRWWVSALRHKQDPLPRLCRDLDAVGAQDAAFSVDTLMGVIARTARLPVEIHCPQCPGLSDHETHLLQAASLTQRGKPDLAERTLHTALLSAHGAEFALGPLRGLSDLFAEASLLFRRRRPRVTERSPASVITAWSPIDPTVH